MPITPPRELPTHNERGVKIVYLELDAYCNLVGSYQEKIQKERMDYATRSRAIIPIEKLNHHWKR